MDFKKITLLCLMLVSATSQISATARVSGRFTEPKTIIIKNPSADNTAQFFSMAKTYFFEIYKPGNPDEIKKLIALVKSQKGVEDFTQQSTAGDYISFVLVLKANQDKAWFISFFKKAGLPFIRINQNAEVAVDKM